MATQFDKLRTIGRVAPKTPATAAVFQDGQKLAYGVVINMSVTGACIVTDHRLVEGHDMTLKLSLYKQAELFEIPARIVWVRKGGARESTTTRKAGGLMKAPRRGLHRAEGG